MKKMCLFILFYFLKKGRGSNRPIKDRLLKPFAQTARMGLNLMAYDPNENKHKPNKQNFPQTHS